jgi:RHS repeat-associated protein
VISLPSRLSLAIAAVALMLTALVASPSNASPVRNLPTPSHHRALNTAATADISKVVKYTRLRNRVYSPELGRFLSRDPLGFGGGDFNLYRYAHANPIQLRDPTGKFAFLAPLVPYAVAFGAGVLAGAGSALVGQAAGNVLGVVDDVESRAIPASTGDATVEADVRTRISNAPSAILPALAYTADVATALTPFALAVQLEAAGANAARFATEEAVAGGEVALEELSGAELAAIDARVHSCPDTATSLLQKHVRGAVDDFAIQGFTARQARRLVSRPGLSAAFQGERIDHFYRLRVAQDPLLREMGVEVTPRFRFGPDAFIRSQSRWWDVTTPAAWNAHVLKYQPRFGSGTLLSY